MLSANALRDHLAYSAWASSRLVEAAAQLTPEQLTRDFQTADKSVLGTLVHTFGGDRLWFERIAGRAPGTVATDADYQLAVLQTEWPQVHERWQHWAATLTDEAAGENLAYNDLRGQPWRQPVWEVVLHVVNHATHHRGQVSGFLRSMGVEPPALDLIVFYRQRRKDARALQ